MSDTENAAVPICYSCARVETIKFSIHPSIELLRNKVRDIDRGRTAFSLVLVLLLWWGTVIYENVSVVL